MLILVANNKSWRMHHWGTRFNGRIGHLWSPAPGQVITCYPHLPYALDNGRFAALEQGRPWNEQAFIRHCNQSRELPKPPLFIVVPDVRRDHAATLEEWQRWQSRLRGYNAPLAFVVQDGCTPNSIPDDADLLFIGGSDRWRNSNLHQFLDIGLPVHVGRVNGQQIWEYDRLQVYSCDGTGFFRGTDFQFLEHYLRCQVGEAEIPTRFQEVRLDEPQHNYHQSWQLQMNRPNFWTQRIPRNIERHHLLMAMQHWAGTPQKHRPNKWAVSYDGKLYPIKLLISRANIYANGMVWPTHLFSGDKDARRFLCERFDGDAKFAIVEVTSTLFLENAA